MSFTTFFGSELPAGAFGAALISWDFLVDQLCLLPLAPTSPSSSDSSFADPPALRPCEPSIQAHDTHLPSWTCTEQALKHIIETKKLGTQSLMYLRKQLLHFSLVTTLKHKYSIAVELTHQDYCLEVQPVTPSPDFSILIPPADQG
jgi:hypothetical protein